jgi:hypothetical protein
MGGKMEIRMEIKSKIVRIEAADSVVFDLLSHCDNISEYFSSDKIQNFQATETSCSFSIAGAGEIAIALQETNPYSSVTYSIGTKITKAVLAVFSILAMEKNHCELSVKASVDAPPFMASMLKPSLQRLLDLLVSQAKMAAEKTKA